jgi:hypothetical protein
MLNNVVPIEDLGGLARTKARNYETKTVNPALVRQSVYAALARVFSPALALQTTDRLARSSHS